MKTDTTAPYTDSTAPATQSQRQRRNQVGKSLLIRLRSRNDAFHADIQTDIVLAIR